MDSHPPYKTFTDTTLQLQIIVFCGSRKYPYHPYRRDLPYDGPLLWIFWNQPPNFSPLCHTRNDVWETNAEVPYWWRVTAKILVVLLIGHTAGKIRSTTQIWVVMHHQYRISVLVSQASFHGETFGGIVKCWLFSQAKQNGKIFISTEQLCHDWPFDLYR